MSNDFIMELDELANESGYLASMALTLEDAMNSGSAAEGYAGAAHLLSNLMHNHKLKMKELLEKA